MRKKVLSLLLSLSMIMAIVANCTMVSAIGDSPKIFVEYYSDETMQNKITTADVGGKFFAAVGVDDLEGCTTAKFIVGLDSSKVKLVDYTTETGITLPQGGVVGKPSLNNSLDNLKNYGIKILSTWGLTTTFSNATPKLITKPDRFVSNSEVAVGEESILLDVMMYTTSGATISDPTVVLLFQLEAIDEGTTALTFPKKVASADASADYYTAATGVQLASNMGVGLIDVTPDPAAGLSNITVSNAGISLVRNIPKLNAPANVQRNGRTITWTPVTTTVTGDPVSAGMISDYKVTVTATGGIGAGTYIIEGNDTTANSAQLPDAFVCGDLSITVQAVSANTSTLANSDANTAQYAGRVTIDLTAPQNVKWNDSNSTEVIWDEVPNASSYKVEITENGTPITISPETVTVNAYDFVNYLNNPADGNKNEYVAKVTALGDDVYVNSDTVGATAPKKVKVGRVRDVSSAGWETDAKKAVWTDTNDPAIVRGYSIRLLKDGVAVTEPQEYITTTNKFYDFTSMMREPGRYTYEVKVLGKTTVDGTYDDSANYKGSSQKIVTKQLDKVTNIQWNGKVATWESDGVHSYTIQVFKGGSQIGTDILATEKRYDFGAIMSTRGDYEIKIRVNGEPPVYLASDWETSAVSISKNSHTVATGLVWDGTTAKWDSDSNATSGYTVQLYYEGNKIDGESYLATTNEYDFNGMFDWPGNYTFSVVKRETNDLLASEEVISTSEYTHTVTTRQGTLSVKAYSDEACTTELTSPASLAVGDVFYLTISMNGTGNFDLFAFPLIFDPAKVKIVGDNNTPVADGLLTRAQLDSGECGVKSEAILDRMTLLEGDRFTSLDNTNGRLFVMAHGDNTVSSNEEKIITVKMVVNSFSSDPITFEFAKAHENVITGGFLFSLAGQPLFANETYPAPISIVVGQLPKMAAPVWNGTDITWVKSGSPNVTSYSLELYKNGTLIDTITGISPDSDSYALATQVAMVGTYTVRIKAIGDANATDSEWSDLSDNYVRRGGGGGSSKPPKPVEPDKPEDPEQPGGTVTPDKPVIEFIDIAGHWAEEQIKELSTYGILAGYEDNTFRPNFGITRAEFTKLMVSALGFEDYEVKEETIYDDTVNHWAKDYISIGTELGFVSGIGNNLFAPDVIITREQVAAIIHRIAGEVEATSISQYADREEVTNYAKNAVDYISEKNIMIGFEDNTFRGKEQTTRAQMVIVLLKLLKGGFFTEYKMN